MKREFGGLESTIDVGGTKVCLIKSDGLSIVAVAMKPGPVETALIAEAVLGRFPCRFVISTGPVGALTEDLRVADWGFVESLVPYQKVGDRFSESANQKPTDVLVADEVRELFNHPSFSDWKPENRPTWIASSGEKFIQDSSERLRIQRIGRTDVVEMNLFGLDSALRRRRASAVHLRVVSDMADENAREDFLNFVESYDGLGGRICAKVLKRLPPDPNSPASYQGLRALMEGRKEKKE